ncbi:MULTISPECIES: phosphate signaling complex protein PhoU [Deefgea]|uniref:Phosphate-specific transport system accessory protein PhoU n=1 Tax=Deefgea piscis TaxID=2739061 RepID=A0A6M8SLK1_9NEIS|nr:MULTISPECIES: phosphate signaling complex protein PhoU [Deefgea]MBM5573978.1 phosphate signaling complex protein PhoU [Deefgea sp. CFH1-16]QKJ65963.1 phosphate signaling complex protein PhoU [Deefgea piscis]
MSEHISKQFDADLEAIRSQVMGMAGLVEEQVRLAMQALASGDVAIINKVIDQETQVNQMHVKLDDMCVHMIARRQPAATDLRMVMTVIKSVEDLERIGDKAYRICKRAKNIYESGRLQVPRFHDLNHIADLALDMLSNALDSFARMDAVSASEVIRADAQLDQEYQALHRQLITVMMEDPRSITLILDILWIAKAIERIGDLGVNVAEHVIYLVKGQDVRHKTQEEVDRVALQ